MILSGGRHGCSLKFGDEMEAVEDDDDVQVDKFVSDFDLHKILCLCLLLVQIN